MTLCPSRPSRAAAPHLYRSTHTRLNVSVVKYLFLRRTARLPLVRWKCTDSARGGGDPRVHHTCRTGPMSLLRYSSTRPVRTPDTPLTVGTPGDQDGSQDGSPVRSGPTRGPRTATPTSPGSLQVHQQQEQTEREVAPEDRPTEVLEVPTDRIREEGVQPSSDPSFLPTDASPGPPRDQFLPTRDGVRGDGGSGDGVRGEGGSGDGVRGYGRSGCGVREDGGGGGRIRGKHWIRRVGVYRGRVGDSSGSRRRTRGGSTTETPSRPNPTHRTATRVPP